MAGKTDKTKLASAILNVGATRITGVEKGATVNGGSEKAENAPQKPQGVVGTPSAGVGEVEAARGAPEPADAPSSVDPADAKTDRVAFLCSPKEKKHLKRMALDRDTDMSSLIREALEEKGYLQ